MTVRMRILSGFRLMCILSHGGMLVPVQGAYCACRGRDTRSQRLGWVSPHIIARLRSLGWLEKQVDFPDRFAASPGLPVPVAGPHVRPPRDILRTGRSAAGRDFASQLLEQETDPGMRVRQKAASGRFRDDFRRASKPDSVRVRQQSCGTANWAAKMSELEMQIGVDAMRCLEGLLIDMCSANALSLHMSCRAADVEAVSMRALAALASAYDLSPVADSPARASARIRSSMDASPLDR